MNIKPGDEVRALSNGYYGESIIVGNVYEVAKVYSGGAVDILSKGRAYHMFSEEIEPVTEDNAIEPEHYRKGQIDLIESWYLRYPFNEFKTGMVMYADRYFNRSKNNRVEDMEKGLYVMQRLKEYEELEKEKDNE